MPEPTVDAILVTFGRTTELAESCRALLGQTTGVRTLVIVDNNESPVAGRVVADLAAEGTDVRVLHPGSNLGPAGGLSAGFDHLREEVGNLDWVLMLDDDDPLPAPDLLARLLGCVELAGERRVGGVALAGARFSPLLLHPVRVDLEAGGLIPTEWLVGWGAPLYRAAALEEVGSFRAELFWGLEEADLGIRLTRGGWELLAAADVLLSLPEIEKAVERSGGPRLRLGEPSPRDYYNLRNAIDLGRRYFGLGSVALAIGVRAIGKPLANLLFQPSIAVRTLRQNLRAIRDGLGGRLGARPGLRP